MLRSWTCRDRSLVIGRRTLVMGILNVTPNSFHDGGRTIDPGAALARAAALVEGGADIVDVGGESTRPGAVPVDAEEEMRRVGPVIERIVRELDVAISIDTSKASVAAHALDRGAHLVNDVSAMADPAMPRVVASAGAGLVLMHMRGTPRTMQQAPHYRDVVAEVAEYLATRVDVALGRGIASGCVAIDPGIGFGKTFAHNWELIRHLDRLATFGYPVLVGPSRKAFLGEVADGAGPEGRGPVTFAASVVAVLQGADVLRLHDPAEARPFLAVADRVRYGASPEPAAP